MNDYGRKQQNIICHCSGTTKEKIKTLIENEITDLDSLSRKTGVFSGCGACENLILQLIAE
jgi:bacterioferritin-associated ferredoxin